MVATLLCACTLMDYFSYKIPNELNIIGFAAAAAYNMYVYSIAYGLLYTVINSLVIIIFLIPIYVIGGIGGGDVKLLAVIGGWVGIKKSVELIIAAFFVTAIVGVILIINDVLKKIKLHTHKIHLTYAISIAGILLQLIRTKG